MSYVHTATQLASKFLSRRASRKRWAAFESRQAPLPRDHYRAVVYFADSPVNLYQLEQWYEPMMKLSETHPVAVIARNIITVDHLKDHCPIPVTFLPNIGDVETWMREQPVGAVFYLNQNARNFQMMRFREPAHVFLSHGESEKDYMASNQLKAYDYTFIAGDAARDRLRGKLIGYDVDARTIEIGRPQVDVHTPAPFALPSDDRTVVLYAPTWEGDRPSMSYSSLVSHAEAMVGALLATGKHRVIYRPHPRTGITDPRFKHAHERVVHLLRAANSKDPRARHIIDERSAFGWHLDAADVCIADISAVAFDWLPTGKPILLTRPSSPDAHVSESGIAGTLLTISRADASEVDTILLKANDVERLARRAALVAQYFGDVSPGASMRRWLDAARSTIDSRTSL